MSELSAEAIPESFIVAVCERLRQDQSVRRRLPGGGLLSIDRELPFLCVYRRSPTNDDAGTRSFASHEAAYLSAPGNAKVRQGLRKLVQRIATQAADRFGAYLILEIRSGRDIDAHPVEDPATGERLMPPPGFVIHAESEGVGIETVNALRFELERTRLFRESANVDVQLDSQVHPEGLRRILPPATDTRVVTIGLEIKPIYRDPTTGAVFPKVLDDLRRRVGRVLKKTFHAFVTHQTSFRADHYYALGRRRIARQVWDADRRLAAISRSFDPLLLVTPINVMATWRAFAAGGYRERPRFRYRPLPFDPFVKKRELLDIPVERIDDPTLSYLLRATQQELDRQLTMLADIGTERFRWGSMQVYDVVERQLLEQATTILDLTPASDEERKPSRNLGPAAFARRAEAELESYRRLDPGFSATVERRDDMYSGLMVSGNTLLVGQGTSISTDRVAALLSHEIGVHLVTRHNGSRQPMQLLESGLAGYDPLQEGLAVLAEHLVGGLSRDRLRTLAARVVAADAMVSGAPFGDVFARLNEGYGFPGSAAFTITARVFRGGGLTKDAAYLRGLNQVVQYLHSGQELDLLFVGKIAWADIPLVRELRLREVLRPPALLPLFINSAAGRSRLAQLRSYATVVDLVRDGLG